MWRRFLLQHFSQFESKRRSPAAISPESSRSRFPGWDQAAVICCVTRADSLIDPAMIQQRHTPETCTQASTHTGVQALNLTVIQTQAHTHTCAGHLRIKAKFTRSHHSVINPRDIQQQTRVGPNASVVAVSLWRNRNSDANMIPVDV